MSRYVAIAAAAVAATLAGCALKAPPPREDVAAQALPNFRVQESWAATAASSGAVADRWLASFNDPQLDALVAEALAYNPDLRVARRASSRRRRTSAFPVRRCIRR